MYRVGIFCILLLGLVGHSQTDLTSAGRSVLANPEAQLGDVSVGRFRALVIGIDRYSDSKIAPLRTPLSDCKALVKVLEQSYGFTDTLTLYGADANRDRVRAAFALLQQKLGTEDSLLVYFAGHGVYDSFQAGSWLLDDARADQPTSFFPNSVLRDYLGAMKARHILLISDSCFSGSFFGVRGADSPEIDQPFFRSQYQKKSRWGLTSGSLEPVDDGKAGGHSLFARFLLDYLNTSERSLFTALHIFDSIGPQIANNGDQVPMCQPLKNLDDAGGRFVFIKNGTLEPPVIKTAQYGDLKISSAGGGKLFINKKLKDTLAPYEIIEIRHMPAGYQEIVIEAAGFETITERLLVKPSQVTQKDFEPKLLVDRPVLENNTPVIKLKESAKTFTSPSTGNVDALIAEARAAANRQPADDNAQFHLLQVYLDNGRISEAESIMRRLGRGPLGVTPTYAGYFAQYQYLTKGYKVNIKALAARKAIDERGRVYLGLSYLAKGKYREAKGVLAEVDRNKWPVLKGVDQRIENNLK